MPPKPMVFVPNALKATMERAMRAEARKQQLEIQLAYIAGLDVEARDRWFAEVERRQEATGMTVVDALESVYQDVIAGRMR